MAVEGLTLEDPIQIRYAEGVDHDYIKTLGIEIASGRDFSRESPADTNAWIINEAAVRHLGLASVSSIVGLLSKDFLTLVGIGFVIAVPSAYIAMQRWLEGFAYRIEIGPAVFILVGAVVLMIALLTVSYQSIRAALADPVRSLRYE